MSGTFASDFAGARPVAQHCAELTWRGPRPEERAENVTAWRRDLAAELAQELAQLFTNGKLHVTVAEAELMPGEQVFERIGPVAANCLLRCGDADQTVLLSLDYATAVALTDCSFGGEGHLPQPAPAQLPRSAALLIEKFAAMIARAITLGNGSAQRVGGEVLIRSESVTRLKPFSGEAEVALFPLTLATGTSAEWKAILAVAADRLDGLLPGQSPAPRGRRNFAGAPGAMHATFAALPMPLEAVLGEFEMTLGMLEQLQPGDEIPLTIARDLPLRMGDLILAHGALGTFENRMALRVTTVAGKPTATTPDPHQSLPEIHA